MIQGTRNIVGGLVSIVGYFLLFVGCAIRGHDWGTTGSGFDICMECDTIREHRRPKTGKSA